MNKISLPRNDNYWLPIPLPWCVDCMTHRVRNHTAYWCVMCDPEPKPIHRDTRLALDRAVPISTSGSEIA